MLSTPPASHPIPSDPDCTEHDATSSPTAASYTHSHSHPAPPTTMHHLSIKRFQHHQRPSLPSALLTRRSFILVTQMQEYPTHASSSSAYNSDDSSKIRRFSTDSISTLSTESSEDMTFPASPVHHECSSTSIHSLETLQHKLSDKMVPSVISVDDVTTLANPITGKRARILQEILDSETRYVEAMEFVKQNYLTPLEAASGTPAEILPSSSIQAIFSNFLHILNLNRELLRRLSSRLHDLSASSVCVGDIFIHVGPYLKMYSVYYTNFTTALGAISSHMTKNQAFAQFMEAVFKKPQSKNLRLDAYLIMPIQRIPRYKLLLEQLLKYTHPDHADYLSVLRSVDLIAKVAALMNEKIYQYGMAVTMLNIQRSIIGLDIALLSAGRRLIHHGPVIKICRRTDQPRYFFLFTDILIYARPLVRRFSIVEDQYIFHRILQLDLCHVENVDDTDRLKNVFQLVGREKSFAMYTDSAEAKAKWLKCFTHAIAELRGNRRTLKRGFILW
ncbi:Dbl homology domain-containing protein [Chytridium lagenaria]|nr:Dbl homology domain-containing protein [Chytridium lagenaria]